MNQHTNEYRRLMTVHEAVEYQRRTYGHVAFGRDALYAIARTEKVPVIKNGKRKVLFPVSSIDALMTGI